MARSTPWRSLYGCGRTTSFARWRYRCPLPNYPSCSPQHALPKHSNAPDRTSSTAFDSPQIVPFGIIHHLEAVSPRCLLLTRPRRRRCLTLYLVHAVVEVHLVDIGPPLALPTRKHHYPAPHTHSRLFIAPQQHPPSWASGTAYYTRCSPSRSLLLYPISTIDPRRCTPIPSLRPSDPYTSLRIAHIPCFLLFAFFYPHPDMLLVLFLGSDCHPAFLLHTPPHAPGVPSTIFTFQSSLPSSRCSHSAPLDSCTVSGSLAKYLVSPISVLAFRISCCTTYCDFGPSQYLSHRHASYETIRS